MRPSMFHKNLAVHLFFAQDGVRRRPRKRRVPIGAIIFALIFTYLAWAIFTAAQHV